MQDIVNVLMHGVYGYVLGPDCIEVYTPAVYGHIYRAGGADYKKAQQLRRTAYNLRGVAGDLNNSLDLDHRIHPILPLSDSVLDPFKKRYCMFRLPYPKTIPEYSRRLFAVDAYEVGSVFAGKHSGPLNALDSCPSMLIIVYGRSEKFLRLDPDDGGVGIDLSGLEPKPGTNIVNLHVWCTINPDDMTMCGMTREGHLRKAYAALVDLIPTLETTIEIPDRFSPAACSDVCPPGVTPCDIDPGRKGCMATEFGKVNCHYSTLILVPSMPLRGY